MTLCKTNGPCGPDGSPEVFKLSEEYDILWRAKNAFSYLFFFYSKT